MKISGRQIAAAICNSGTREGGLIKLEVSPGGGGMTGIGVDEAIVSSQAQFWSLSIRNVWEFTRRKWLILDEKAIGIGTADMLFMGDIRCQSDKGREMLLVTKYKKIKKIKIKK